MKLLLLTILFYFTTTALIGQIKMNIILNDGNTKSGVYKIKDNTLGYATKTKIVSERTKEKYKLEEIKSIIIYTETDSIFYEVIQVKKNLDSKNVELKLGQMGFRGNAIELFYVSEYVYQRGAVTPITTVSSYNHIYLKKKNDRIAYNMGYIYGAGQTGIKPRVRDFFSDCPKLIEHVENNKIPKKETLKIALFYENNCDQ